MSAGALNHLTPAPGVVGGADESTFFSFPVPTSALVKGTNVVAVEVHQQNAASSDVSFDLRLTGVKTQTATPLFLSPAGLHTVKARLLNGPDWSALTAATFLVDAEPATAANLAVTELHYHPADPSPADTGRRLQLQRSTSSSIELTNTGSLPIDLGGLAFIAGIDFTFDSDNPYRILAPGQSVLLVSNSVAFELRYGPGSPIAGSFAGSLNNDGEQLTLVDASQATIRDFTYNDADPGRTAPTAAATASFSSILPPPPIQIPPRSGATAAPSAAIPPPPTSLITSRGSPATVSAAMTRTMTATASVPSSNTSVAAIRTLPRPAFFRSPPHPARQRRRGR